MDNSETVTKLSIRHRMETYITGFWTPSLESEMH